MFSHKIPKQFISKYELWKIISCGQNKHIIKENIEVHPDKKKKSKNLKAKSTNVYRNEEWRSGKIFFKSLLMSSLHAVFSHYTYRAMHIAVLHVEAIRICKRKPKGCQKKSHEAQVKRYAQWTKRRVRNVISFYSVFCACPSGYTVSHCQFKTLS